MAFWSRLTSSHRHIWSSGFVIERSHISARWAALLCVAAIESSGRAPSFASARLGRQAARRAPCAALLDALAAHQRCHDRLLDVEPVFRLVPNPALGTIDYRRGNLFTAV